MSATVTVVRLAVLLYPAFCILLTPAMAQSVGNCTARVVVGSPTTDAGDGGPALRAQFFSPMGLARDSSGNLYIADSGNNKIRVVRTDGTVQTIAGTGIAGGSGDGGVATSAQLNNPVAVAVGPGGVVYIVENTGNRIRKVSSDGTIHTIAGTGRLGFGGDGASATQARLTNPSAIAFDADGNLYIADTGNSRIRKVAKDGTISTFAGTGSSARAHDNPDGTPAIKAIVILPTGLVFAPNGVLYIATHDQLQSITADGLLHTVGGVYYNGKPVADGVPATQAALVPLDIATDSQGGLVYVDGAGINGQIVWRIGADGKLHSVVTTYYGWGLLVESDGSFLRTAYFSSTVMKYTPGLSSSGISPNVVIAGLSRRGISGDGGPGTQAALGNPGGLAADSAGNIFIADSTAGQIRKLDNKGIMSTVAGSAGTNPTPDGLPALQSVLIYPTAIAVSPAGEIYYSDEIPRRVRKIGTDGKIMTVAGNGSYPSYFYVGDGREGAKATSVSVNADSLALDENSNLYISDNLSLMIWRVTADGILHAVARTNTTNVIRPLATDPSGVVYYLDLVYPRTLNLMRTGNGSSAQIVRNIGNYFDRPLSFAIDAEGNLYLNDDYGPKFYKANADGSVSVLTNTSTPPPNLSFSSVVLDRFGNLFAADIARSRVLEIPAAATCTASRLPIIGRQGVLNAAGYQPFEIAPGEIVDIFGTVVGPDKLAHGAVGSDGKLTTSVGGTQVLFDGVAVPMLYASSGQTAAIVPFGVVGQEYSNVQVFVNGFLSDSVAMQVQDTSAGIFTQDASGSGPGSILNEDYSINSAAHPAPKGSVVMVYMTGLGLVNPAVPDGAITGSPVSHQVHAVTAVVNSELTDVLYAGTAPGLVAGANQVNIRIPPNAPSGNVSIQVTVGQGPGSTASQANVTVAVE